MTSHTVNVSHIILDSTDQIKHVVNYLLTPQNLSQRKRKCKRTIIIKNEIIEKIVKREMNEHVRIIVKRDVQRKQKGQVTRKMKRAVKRKRREQ